MFRTYDTSAIRPKRSPLPAIIGIVVLVVALVAIVVGVLSYTKSITPEASLVSEGTEVEITIADGEGAKSVAKSLADAGLISDQNEFVDRVSQLGDEATLQPGTYTLTGGQSIDEILAVLQKPVEPTMFTIPEGCTIAQTAEIVSQASEGRISVEDFVAAAGNAAAYAPDYPFLGAAGENSLEGFLFPKTYPIADDSTADSLIRAMLDQFGVETAGLDLSYAESFGFSLYDVVNLASIIEKESDADHRAEVSSVFYNRLADGWMLQSDATIAYVVGHDPTPEDVDTYHEYNTYFNAGLPPTPINSPSIECLQAACHPADTAYYYFYFEDDGNGGLNYTFSETYEEHQATYE